jgi:Na+/melibiose symporter-like transporter
MKLLSDTVRERSVWANRDFLYLWGATVISQLGTQITFLGLPFLAVTMLNATPLQTSVLAMLGWVPVVALGFVAGAIIDRGRRQPVLIWCDVARAVVMLTVPVAYLFGGLSLWQLYAVVLLMGVFSTFFDTAYQARVPSLVPDTQLVAANSGLEIAQSGTRIVGPGLAGALIALLTAPLAILLDALSYLLSALLLLGIRAPESVSDMPPSGTRADRPLRVDIKEGLVFFWRKPLLRSLVGCTVLMSVGWALVEGIFLFYLIRTLGLDAGLTGVIFSFGNVGLLVAAAVTGRLVGRWGLGPVVGSAVVLHAGGILLIALAPLAPLPFLVEHSQRADHRRSAGDSHRASNNNLDRGAPQLLCLHSDDPRRRVASAPPVGSERVVAPQPLQKPTEVQHGCGARSPGAPAQRPALHLRCGAQRSGVGCKRGLGSDVTPRQMLCLQACQIAI